MKLIKSGAMRKVTAGTRATRTLTRRVSKKYAQKSLPQASTTVVLQANRVPVKKLTPEDVVNFSNGVGERTFRSFFTRIGRNGFVEFMENAPSFYVAKYLVNDFGEARIGELIKLVGGKEFGRFIEGCNIQSEWRDWGNPVPTLLRELNPNIINRMIKSAGGKVYQRGGGGPGYQVGLIAHYSDAEKVIDLVKLIGPESLGKLVKYSSGAGFHVGDMIKSAGDEAKVSEVIKLVGPKNLGSMLNFRAVWTGKGVGYLIKHVKPVDIKKFISVVGLKNASEYVNNLQPDQIVNIVNTTSPVQWKIALEEARKAKLIKNPFWYTS